MLKLIFTIFLFLIAFRVIFINVETDADRFEAAYGENDYEGPNNSTWKWRLTGNEIKMFSFSSREDYPERDGHAYTECSWFGSEIWIDGYTKDDGTEVQGYYRKRPSCW